MGWFEGLLTGYNDRRYTVEREEALKAEQAAQREERIYRELLNSRDPETKAMAGAGMLQLGQPRQRKGGFAGWIGEMEQSPVYPALLKHAQTARWMEEDDPNAPMPPPYIPQTPGAQPAAQPATSPTQAGSPGLTPTTPATPPAQPPPLPPFPMITPGGVPGPSEAARMQMRPQPRVQQPIGAPRIDPATLAPQYPAPTPTMPPAGPQTPPTAPAAAGGAAGLSSNISGAQVAGLPQPGLSPTPPPAPPQPGMGAPPLGAAAPPPPPQTTSLAPGPPPRPKRTVLRYPDMFPSRADIQAQEAEGEIDAKFAGYTRMYERIGYPTQQAKALAGKLIESENKSRSAGGAALKEGNPRPLPDGTWVQDLYHPFTGELMNTIPHQGLPGTATMQERQMMAQEMFGSSFPGMPAQQILQKITADPKLSSVFLEEISRRKGYIAAQGALMRAKALNGPDAPITKSAEISLTNFMIQDWEKHQKPMREMRQQLVRMEEGEKALLRGDSVGGSQAILVTFQKILDPTSVVRESEYDRSVTGLPIKRMIEGYWQKYVGAYGIDPSDPEAVQKWMTTGVAIPLEDLQKMVVTARSFITGLAEHEEVEKNRIKARAEEYEIPLNYIFADVPGTMKPPPVTGPPIDPNKPNPVVTSPGVTGITIGPDGKPMKDGKPWPPPPGT